MAGLAEQLGGGEHRLDWLVYEDLSMRDCLAAGYVAIRSEDELAARVFELLGSASDAPVLPDGAATQLDVTAERARRALEKLVDAYLAYRDESGGYRLPALMREYAAELAAVPWMPRIRYDSSGPSSEPPVLNWR